MTVERRPIECATGPSRRGYGVSVDLRVDLRRRALIVRRHVNRIKRSTWVGFIIGIGVIANDCDVRDCNRLARGYRADGLYVDGA